MLYRQVSRGHLASTHSYAVCRQRDGKARASRQHFRPYGAPPLGPGQRFQKMEPLTFMLDVNELLKVERKCVGFLSMKLVFRAAAVWWSPRAYNGPASHGIGPAPRLRMSALDCGLSSASLGHVANGHVFAQGPACF